MKAFIVDYNGLVTSRHNMPFDENFGFAKDAADAISQGWTLYSGEIPEDKVNGNQIGRVHYDKLKNRFYYEWETLEGNETTSDSDTGIKDLKNQLELIQQALDELIISSSNEEKIKELSEKQDLMQKALDELIITNIPEETMNEGGAQ
ncbi:hypothetical protein U3450_003877 [Bacillus cytotoxicus]|uniref:hypothetical protein n=1 Tax=unclassified Bacillus cereus group TaxID=2750818 RepID=UPI001F5AC6CB|nr:MULTISPECIES: hypothetical protein [unclassified Bacillus cereus group]EMA6344821.1 hypothetical protein [Bacillus cytotoxicus]